MKKIKIEREEERELWKVCVLPLCGNNFYIGYGEQIAIEEFLDKDWVRFYGIDCEQKVQFFEFSSDHDAFWDCFKRTIEMMELLGVEKIRSDVFSDMELSPTILAYIDNLYKHKVVTSFADLVCTRCGRRGHTAEVCYSATDIDKNYIGLSSDTSSDSSSD